MTSARLLALLLLLAAAAGGLWWALGALEDRPPPGPPLPELSETSLIRLPPAELDRLTLHQPRFNLTVRLERDARGAWRLTEPMQDLAEPVAVFSALNALYSNDWSEAPEDWGAQDRAALGLEPADLALEARAGGQSQTLRLGATDYSGRWRAAELDGRLMRVGEGLVSPLLRDVETWRDHRLLPVPPPAVTKIRWTPAAGPALACARADGGWRLIEPFAAPMDERQTPFLERMLGARAQLLRRERLAERPLRGDLLGRLEVSAGGADYALELRADGLAASHREFAMDYGFDDFEILFRDPESLRSPRLLALAPGSVVTIRVTRGAEEGVFRRAPGGWSLEGFGALPAEEGGFLDALLDHGARIEGAEWIPVPTDPPAGSARYSISRTPRDGSPTLLWWLREDGAHVAAAEGSSRATPTAINFDRAVAELFRRIAALRG